MLYDSHNHLQDERLQSRLGQIIADARAAGVARMVVNGSCESDWPDVMKLAKDYPEVLPSFGYHPWYVKGCTPEWKARLVECLDSVPSAVGEIGLDRWIKGHDVVRQEEVFLVQLQIAAERELPVSIHCLQAWGRLLQLLRENARPRCGFLLHSYGGSTEMIQPLARLGAYFSLPGYFAHERKHRQRETFKQIPLERLLIETDAPDQLLPEDRVRYPLVGEADGKPLNHPANLVAVYEFASEITGVEHGELRSIIQANFERLFGRCA